MLYISSFLLQGDILQQISLTTGQIVIDVLFAIFCFSVRVALDEGSDDVGHPSEKDLNDSFPEDEDEEEYESTDEDSDWQPGKDEEEKEDVEELLKEAKRFMKRKK